ncbi:MAG: Cof-type HAD-IIB family hydrolase [Verrucomicrobiota bacterium]
MQHLFNSGKSRRLALIDLDDTLLGPDKQISNANRRALERLRSAGFETVIASGRLHQNIVRFEGTIGTMGWIVSSAGALVRHAVSGQSLHELTLSKEEALEVFAAGRAAGLSMIVYHRDGVFIEKESEWTRLYAERAGWKPERADLLELAASGVQKVLLSHSAETMASLRGGWDERFGKRFYMVETDREMIEFLSPRANKVIGAEAVAREMGIERADVVAFGDGNNDVELLAWAGFSVAMAHGRPAAHTAASRISPPGPPETAFARAADLVLSEVSGWPSPRRVDALEPAA